MPEDNNRPSTPSTCKRDVWIDIQGWQTVNINDFGFFSALFRVNGFDSKFDYINADYVNGKPSQREGRKITGLRV